MPTYMQSLRVFTILASGVIAVVCFSYPTPFRMVIGFINLGLCLFNIGLAVINFSRAFSD